MKKLLLPMVLVTLFVLQSCSSKKSILYVQDVDAYDNTSIVYATTKIQPNDILKVEISDLNPLVAAPFNIIPVGGNQSGGMNQINGYLVSPKGSIVLPILNEMNVSGLTSAEAEVKVKKRLMTEGYLVNPTVQVRVLNNKFTILGEVNKPGVIPFAEQSISLLNAIGMAGDLTYSGVREDVKIIREADGKRLVYHVDLTTAKWMANPDYQIRQNDVILVTPNKLKSSSGRTIKDPLQVISVLTTVLALYLLFKR
jgi:polysaccharide export outer membrane protein